MKRIVTLTLALSLCCSVTIAQQGQNGPGQRRPGQGARGNGPGGGSRPGTPGSATLETAGVKIGQALPDLTIFDERGGELRLADLKGKYSVIVFGCLT